MDNSINELKKLYDLMPFWIIVLILTGIMLNLIPYFYEGYDEYRNFSLFTLILIVNACIFLIYLYMNRDKRIQDYKKGLEKIKKEPELKEKIEKTTIKISYIFFVVGVNIIIIGIVLMLIQVIESDIMELFIIMGISLCGSGLYIYFIGKNRRSKM